MRYIDFFMEHYGWQGAALAVVIIVLFAVQTYYYAFVYARIPKYRNDRRKRRTDNDEPEISVIVPLFSENAEFLETGLLKLLAQEYGAFEIVVVYVGLDTDFYEDLTQMRLYYPNLHTTKIEAKPHFPISPKMAINIGIKAAHYEHIILTTPDSSPRTDRWLTLMAHGGMSILSKAACEKDPVKGPYLGSGMFSLEEWIPGSHCSFVRYDGYRKGPAPTRRIDLKLYKEASTRLIALQTGEIDVCIDPSTTDLQRIAEDPKLDLIQTPNVVMLYMPMQMEKPGLDNVHVRKALAHAMDKDSIVFAAYDGLATIHNNYINRGQFGLNPDIHVYEYDLEKAAAELELSGYKPGDLTFHIMVDNEAKKTAALIFQNSCAQIGINIVLEEMETAALKGKLNDAALDYELALYQFTDDLGTDYTLRNQHGSTMQEDGTLKKNGSNRCNMKDEKFNEMLDAALVETDVEQRRQDYYEIENYLDEICPIVPICTSYINIGAKKGLVGAIWKPDAKHDFRLIALPE